jgi:hypothetical protein
MGSVSPLGDLQARLQGGERANFREAKFPCHKCSTYSGNGSPETGKSTAFAVLFPVSEDLSANLSPAKSSDFA